MLGNILTALLRNNDFDKATTIMQKLDSEHQKIVGVAQLNALNLYLEHAIKEKTPSNAIVTQLKVVSCQYIFTISFFILF